MFAFFGVFHGPAVQRGHIRSLERIGKETLLLICLPNSNLNAGVNVVVYQRHGAKLRLSFPRQNSALYRGN